MEKNAQQGIYETLLSRMRALTDAYAHLLALAQQKQIVLAGKGDAREAVLDGRNEGVALEALTEQERLGAKAANDAEEARARTVSAIAMMLNVDEKQLHHSMLCSLADTKTGEALVHEGEKLLETLFQLKDQNAMNRHLLEVKLDYQAFIVNVLTNQQSGTSNTYGASGEEDAHNDIPRILDSEV